MGGDGDDSLQPAPDAEDIVVGWVADARIVIETRILARPTALAFFAIF